MFKRKLYGIVADKYLKKKGYTKQEDSNLVVKYVKKEGEFLKPEHILELQHMASGEHMIFSYWDCYQAVGISSGEAAALLMKMKSKGWKI